MRAVVPAIYGRVCVYVCICCEGRARIADGHVCCDAMTFLCIYCVLLTMRHTLPRCYRLSLRSTPVHRIDAGASSGYEMRHSAQRLCLWPCISSVGEQRLNAFGCAGRHARPGVLMAQASCVFVCFGYSARLWRLLRRRRRQQRRRRRLLLPLVANGRTFISQFSRCAGCRRCGRRCDSL